MAEFALIVPVFLLLFVAITGFGQAFYYWLKANHAANETARWAAVDRNPITGKTLQQQVVDDIGTANVCLSFENGAPAVGDYLTVRISKPLTFKVHLPLLPALDTGFTIRGTSTQRIENLPASPTPPTAYKLDGSDNIPPGPCP